MSRSALTLADAIDGVRWEYDPAQQMLSPLVSTSRWFEGFPWDGEEGDNTTSWIGLAPEGEARGDGVRGGESGASPVFLLKTSPP